MNYEIVQMKAKTFAGVADVTNNASPDMTAKKRRKKLSGKKSNRI